MKIRTILIQFLTALLPVVVLLTGCQGPSGSSNSDQLAVGQFANQVPLPLPSDLKEPAPIKAATQVRLQKSADGTVTSLEYLDPLSETQEVWKTLGKIEIHEAGTQLHHWGPENDVQHWAKNGIKPEEIDRAVRAVDHADYLGGGFYMSLDLFDSSSYGSKVIIADLKRDIVTLDINDVNYHFDNENKSITVLEDSDRRVNISVPMIADAGIESIRYRTTWMVVIRGTPVENLVEGSWANFIAQTSKKKTLDILDLMKFSAKYPLTDNDANDPAFQKNFSVAYRMLKKQPVPHDEQMSFVKPLLDQFAADGGGSDFDSSSAANGLGSVYEAIKAPLREGVVNQLKQWLALKKYSKYEWKYMTAVGTFKLTLKDLDPGYEIIGNMGFFGSEIQNFNGPVYYHNAEDYRRLSSKIVMEDFYLTLDQLVKGKMKISNSGENAPPTELELLHRKLNQDSNGQSLLERTAEFWAKKQVNYRETVIFEVGKHFLDGPSRPGFLFVTSKQKEEIESNPLLTIREIRPAQGGSGYYIQYEYPSARTFSRFSHLLQPELVQQLKAASKNGQLKSPESKVFKTLTRAIIRQLVEAAKKVGGTYATYSLFRIHPFDDREVNSKAIRSMMGYQGTAMTFFDPDWSKTLTYPEMIQLSNMSSYWAYSLNRTLQKDAKAMDMNLDIGFWEVAANTPGPHADPHQFIAKVRARFEASDVQSWLQSKDFVKIQKALQEAAAQ